MELYGSLQNYEWGKKGGESEAANLALENPLSILSELDPETPYAELWIGTHPNGPSKIFCDLSLKECLEENPFLIGADVQRVFGVQLPFLLKVLSVNKALSIQVHPSKSEAEELHCQFPEIYKDSNHKPEMAVALTDFEALCGFRSLDEIKKFLECVPELSSCIGQDNVDALMTCSEDCQQEALKKCFHSLMTTPDDEICSALASLLNRLSSLDESSRDEHMADLVERLQAQFPGDVGVFGPYLFNYIKLRPGEALYLAPNEIHAYLYGDCVECMACSDNTIRAGLTPKMKDVPTLCRVLSYICEPADCKLFPGERQDEFTTIFRPPVLDFALARICIPQGKKYSLAPRRSGSICLVISGFADGITGSHPSSSPKLVEDMPKRSIRLILKRGTIIFLGSQEPLELSVETPGDIFLMFQAMANF